ELARAKFYLNKARRAWLNETRLDTIPPDISVKFPPPSYRTNDFLIYIQGTARDDFFISNIVFNGRPSKLELSRKEVSFREEFLLHHGKNVITLQSEDILGKTSVPVTIQIKVDREGPLVFLEARLNADNTIQVTGAVYDKSAIARLSLNGRELVFEKAKFLSLNEDFGGLGLLKDAPIQFEAEDIVGNKTTGNLQTSSSKISTNLSHYPLIAFAQSSKNPLSLPAMTLPQASSLKHLAAVGGMHTPAIDLKGLRDGQTMFYNTLSVEGTVRTGKGIEDLTLNGQSLISIEEDASGTSFLKLLKEKKGRPLAFSKTIQLEEGENTITTALADTTGKVTKKAIVITRKIPRVRQLDSRLKVASFPFTEKKKTRETLRNYVYTFLTRSFVEQKRFNVLGRDKLNKTLEKQQIEKEAIFDQQEAIRLGHLMGSETVLIGEITASKESIEIFSQLIDIKTSITLAEKDVYWEGGLNAGFRETLDSLALKFKQHLPLCEGTVIEERERRTTIDLGRNQSICQGMRFLAFHENDPIYDTITGMDLGSDTEILGLLSVKEIDQTFSRADISQNSKRLKKLPRPSQVAVYFPSLGKLCRNVIARE
ncbi:MAG: hypothetical protein JRJ00_17130, partial [Deltaproteobacteria bacterium]|nr:hypothetical protein [Deltaproteobacteria bacterium]